MEAEESINLENLYRKVGLVWVYFILSFPLLFLFIFFYIYTHGGLVPIPATIQGILIVIYCLSLYKLKDGSSFWTMMGIAGSLLATLLLFGVLWGLGT